MIQYRSCFNSITDKSNCSFIQFEIKELYPSITESILHKILKFVKQHITIEKNDLYLQTIAASRYYFLITKLGKTNRQTTAWASQWVDLMKQKYLN